MVDTVSLQAAATSQLPSWRRLPPVARLSRQWWRSAETSKTAERQTTQPPVADTRPDLEAFMLLDCDGQLLAASAHAQESLKQVGVQAEIGRVLEWRQESATMDLKMPMLLARTQGPQPVVFRGDGSGVLVGMLEKQPNGYLLRLPVTVPTQRLREVLAAQFELTPSQCDVALALGSGISLGDVAVQRGTSINTIRTHANAVFVKLGVRRQGELVSLLQQLRGLVAAEAN